MKSVFSCIHVLFLFALVFASSLHADDPRMVIQTTSVQMPPPTEANLDAGYTEKDPRSRIHALKIKIFESSPRKAWRLLVRSRDEVMMPGFLNKPISHVEWKLNADPPHSYRILTTTNEAVMTRHNGRTQEVKLDLRVATTWIDPAASYSADIIFTLETLD